MMLQNKMLEGSCHQKAPSGNESSRYKEELERALCFFFFLFFVFCSLEYSLKVQRKNWR